MEGYWRIISRHMIWSLLRMYLKDGWECHSLDHRMSSYSVCSKETPFRSHHCLKVKNILNSISNSCTNTKSPFDLTCRKFRASQMVLVVKNPPINVGDMWIAGLFPGSGRSPGEGNGYPLQYSCLENPMDRGAWKAIVHRVAKNQTRLKRRSTHVVHSWFVAFF